MVRAVFHEDLQSHIIGFYQGSKESEKTAVASCFQAQNTLIGGFSMDALHGYPTLLETIAEKKGVYLGAAFRAQQAEWEAKGLYLFFLPKYSPHLNRIERLWKQIKHGWLKAQDYLSLDHLKQTLSNILTGFGTAFTLNFNELDLSQFPILISD